MGDILKEAIADAKAVRETALENAKMALEEAFTPQIKSMLSAKLKEDEIEESDPVVEDEEMEDEEGEAEEGYHEDDEMGDEEEVPAEEGDEMGDEEVADEVPAEEGSYSEDDEPEGDDEVEEENLDLEAIIRELESELSEGEDDEEEVEESTETSEEPVSEGEEEIEEEYEIDESALEEDEELEEELDTSSGIGKGTGRGNTDKTSGIGTGGKLKEVQDELKEYKEAVSFLRGKLHEVNILNAKLLFTNKLFKAYSLDNNQKLKVVETFDRAQTTREIKLVYSTLAEQFGDNSNIVTKKSISESASTVVASTKPSKESKKVISEETNVANRFKKLAGLIK